MGNCGMSFKHKGYGFCPAAKAVSAGGGRISPAMDEDSPKNEPSTELATTNAQSRELFGLVLNEIFGTFIET